MVSALRWRLYRSDRYASESTSFPWIISLLLTKRFYRLEQGRPPCGIESGDNASQSKAAHGEQGSRWVNVRQFESVDRRRESEELGGRIGCADANGTTDPGEHQIGRASCRKRV